MEPIASRDKRETPSWRVAGLCRDDEQNLRIIGAASN